MCKVQHLGQHNPNINQNEGWMDWQQPVEKDLETIDGNLDVSQQCVLAAQSHLHPGLYQKQCGQQVKGGSCAPLLHSWSSRIFQHKKDTDLLEGVQRILKNDLRAGAFLLWRQAENIGIVQPGEEQGTPGCGLSLHKGACKKGSKRLFIK